MGESGVWAMWNGSPSLLGELKVPALDRGFLFGDAVYEVVRAYRGKLWLWPEHERRLSRSLAGLGISYSEQRLREMKARVESLLKRGHAADAGIYVQITRGAPAKRSHLPPKDLEPNELLFVEPLPADYGRERSLRGVNASIRPDQRWGRCDLKTVNLLGNVLAGMAARDQGADEAVLADRGLLTEGTHSSFFALASGVLHTAPLTMNILPSVTRQVVMTLASEMGIKVVESAWEEAKLAQVDEAFLCGTLSEVLPIVRLGSRELGAPGPVTVRLREAFWKMVGREAGVR